MREVASGAVSGWDNAYRCLEEGEVIQLGDEVQNDDGSFDLAVRCVGEQAPDPCYTSHRVYRRAIPKQEGEVG